MNIHIDIRENREKNREYCVELILEFGSAPNIFIQIHKNKKSPEKSTKSPIKWPFFAILSNKKNEKK